MIKAKGNQKGVQTIRRIASLLNLTICPKLKEKAIKLHLFYTDF